MNRILFFAIIVGSLAGCEKNPQSIDGGGYDLRNRTVYVVNGLSETLTAIDVEEGVVYNNIVELGKWPNYITSNPYGTLLYVVNSGDNHVMEIDVDGGNPPRSIDIGIGRNPWQCEVSGTELWTSNFLTGEIAISDIPVGGGTQYVDVGVTLQALVVSGDFVYVTDTNYRYGSFGPGRVILMERAGRNEIGSSQVGINPHGSPGR